MRGSLVSTCLGLIGAALVASPAAAAPAVSGEFPLPAGQTVGSNNEIVEGPDGNMWVTSENNSVVRIQPNGSMTPFPIGNTPFGITVGPDQNLWVSTAIGVTKVPPSNPVGFQAYDIGLEQGRGITAGPDGNMWVVGNGNAAGSGELTRFSPADPENTEVTTQIANLAPRGMDTASDGMLWIADNSGRVLSATAAAAPVITPFAVGGGVQDVGAGPNGQVAYANPLSSPQSVGRIAPGGSPQVTNLENTDPFGVVFGQDGAYWIARTQGKDLLRLTPDGATTTLGGFAPDTVLGPRKIATGPDNTLWVTIDMPDRIARISGVEPPPPPGGGAETTIDKGPKRKVKTSRRKAKVKFRFSSEDPEATFECALKKRQGGGHQDAKPARFKPCSSPRKYKLKPGKYTFQVRATVAGVTDQTPARQKFKVVRDRD